MNKALTLFGSALFLAAASSVFATDTLNVKGVITPASCIANLSSNGVVDHGKVSAKDLNQTAITLLPDATLQLAVNCEAPTPFALKVVDNRATSATNPGLNFGLGLINDVEKIGGFSITLRNPFADGAATTSLQSLDDGHTWENASGLALPPLRLAAFGDQSSGAWAPIEIQDLNVDLRVRTGIAPAQNLTLTDDVAIDGNATLEVHYR
ncbi:DUF1120 domain-containing protein [Pseudomonas sp. PD9R]|uniref:DUF1120 domain-containing protein n=1 Tax=Pseudomonas sp. PD9R TaxID=2853534 RepID=UPI001C44F268|nr:DUF1120 domain-containing protein [Pseudomonas sp. PD9R]MBV6827103.1 DUF1120 domain-containing protein [Pseudomonas sp. PD9R]